MTCVVAKEATVGFSEEEVEFLLEKLDIKFLGTPWRLWLLCWVFPLLLNLSVCLFHAREDRI